MEKMKEEKKKNNNILSKPNSMQQPISLFYMLLCRRLLFQLVNELKTTVKRLKSFDSFGIFKQLKMHDQ